MLDGLMQVLAGEADWPSVTAGGQLVAGGLAVGLGAIGAGVGEGHNAAEAVDSISRQPAAAGDLARTMLVGEAVAETSGIFALVVAFILVFSNPAPCMEVVGAYLGAGLAMGLGALGSGIGAGEVGARAAVSIGRSPDARGGVTIMMLIGQALATSPAVFALVVAVLLAFAQGFQKFVGNDLVVAAKALSAGTRIDSFSCFKSCTRGPTA